MLQESLIDLESPDPAAVTISSVDWTQWTAVQSGQLATSLSASSVAGQPDTSLFASSVAVQPATGSAVFLTTEELVVSSTDDGNYTELVNFDPNWNSQVSLSTYF